MSHPHLPDHEIDELIEVATRLDLADPGLRKALFSSLHPSVANSLRHDDMAASAQLTFDLQRLNQMERLQDGKLPLREWLHQAHRLVGHTSHVFQRSRDRLHTQRSLRLFLEPPEGLPEYGKEVALADGVVPLDFLRLGQAVAASVASVEVRRYDHGEWYAYGGTGRVATGAGWLIGRQLLVVNLHVVRAREEGEEDPDDDDLRLQAASAIVRFQAGVHRGSSGEPVGVAGLEEPRDPVLDYAILRLIRDPPAPPLELAKDPLAIKEDPFPPLTTVQFHDRGPGALSIRTNQATQLDGDGLRYLSRTDPGTSGVPVFDDDWRVVALHRKTSRTARQVDNFQGHKEAFVNLATPIDRIVEHLRKASSALWQEIDAVPVRGSVIGLVAAQGKPERHVALPDPGPLRDLSEQIAEAVARLEVAVSHGRDPEVQKGYLRGLLGRTRDQVAELHERRTAGAAADEGTLREADKLLRGCKGAMDQLLDRVSEIKAGFDPAGRDYRLRGFASAGHEVQVKLASFATSLEGPGRPPTDRYPSE
jgi:endonuclease G, mitochondrial